MKTLLSLFTAAAASLAVFAGDIFQETPVMTLSPSPDLTVCSGFNGFCDTTDNGKIMTVTPTDAHVRLSTDGRILRIHGITENGPKGLLARMAPPAGGLLVVKDDTYEFVVYPHPGKTSECYHFFVNAKGAFWSQAKKNDVFVTWKPEMNVKSTYIGENWDFQLDLKLSDFGIKEWTPEKPIGLRIVRNWRSLLPKYYDNWTQSSWCQLHTPFMAPEKLPLIYCVPSAPAVDFFQVVTRKDRKADPKFRITNTTGTSQTYMVDYRHQPSSSQPVSRKFEITLQSGETKVVDMPVAQATESEKVLTSLTVNSKDGKTLYFCRAFQWDQSSSKNFFAPASGNVVSVITNMAYYPSTNGMHVKVDLRAEKKAASLKNLKVEITTKNGKKIASFDLPKPNANQISETVLQIPDLKKFTQEKNPSGEYKMILYADGLGYKEPVTIPFERKVFAWENNAIGKSKVLIPPFTALKVRNKKEVDVVLRTYTMNGLGLFQGIKAEGCELLTADGIVLEAVIGGKTYQAKSTGFRFTKQDNFEASFEASWKAGPLKAKAEGTMSYDGLMWYTFRMEPCAEKIQSLKMKLAFPEKMVPLMHACTDGLRHNFAGATPKGENRIWQSGDAPRMQIQNDFVPLIWLGKEGPGLSVFADSDKGWIHAKNVPSQELFRKDGKVIQVWNILTDVPANTKFEAIRIGFQASPVKPMMENWRRTLGIDATWHHKEILKYLKKRSIFCGGTIGQGMYYCDYAPRMDDYSIWDAFRKARQTGKVEPGFLENWVKKWPEQDRKGIYREVNYVLGVEKNTYNTDCRIMFYTNPRGVRLDRAENMTFMNDWLGAEFLEYRLDKPGFAQSIAYNVGPVASFRDYAIWGYKNMYDAGIVDQIYWDNVFLLPSYHLDGRSAAYLMPDGRVQPSMEFDTMRELIKRTSIMQIERGIKPDNMAHMTNTMLTPTLSFAQQQLDWEDQYGPKLYQDRNSRENIRAMTIGRQSGCRPNVLVGVFGLEGKARDFCKRTLAGVCLTHELCPNDAGAHDYWKNLIKFYDFGYGTSDTEVFNYWQDDYPASITGGETSSILLRKGKTHQLLICSYGPDADLIAALNGKKIVRAVNKETGAVVPVADGKVKVHLPKYDLIYLELEAE